MKHRILLIASIMLVATVLGGRQANADIASNLTGWWKFDDGAGSTAVDSSSAANTLTLTNGVTWISGKIGLHAETIDGSTQYAQLPSAAFPAFPSGQTGSYNLTFSTWFRTTSSGVILGQDDGALPPTAPSGYVPAIYVGTNGKIYASMFWHGGTSDQIASASAYNDGNWHQVVDAYGSGVETLYIDGASVGSQTFNESGYAGSYAYLLGVGFSSASWANSVSGSNAYFYFSGDIDDVRIYTRTLSAGDVTELYAYTGNSYPSWAQSSADFFLHSLAMPLAGGTPAYPFSTSTSFKLVAAAGETAVGTSSSASFQVQSGFMRNLYKGPAPIYAQIHYHWRNDNGSETAATSMTGGVQDTPVSSVSKLSTDRLRMEISNKGGTVVGYSSQAFRLEYGLRSTTCAAISSWTDVGAPGGDWDMVDSANLTDGGNTTDIPVSAGGVTDENHTFISSNSGIKDISSQVASTSVSSDSFIELEYSIEPLSAATDGGVYCFRVSDGGSTADYAYAQYPQATLANGGSLTFVTDAGSESFPLVTPGTLSATSSILMVTTGNSSGFNVSIQRSDMAGTMSQGSTYIPDKTDWFAPTATTTAGNATASTTQPLTLQFRVRSAGTDAADYASSWWGTDDTTANALFGGVSSTTQEIINRSIAAVSTTTAYVQYDLNVPVSQVTGSYSGSITYTVTANP